MRSTRRLSVSTLSLVAILLSCSTTFGINDENEAEEYGVKARVVRISHLKGSANLRRNGDTEWETAGVNFPLVEGDTVATNRESQLEIQIDSRNFVRLDAQSALKLVTLRDEGVALSLVSGVASVRLAAFEGEREFFEIDAPKATLVAESRGLYRIDVSTEGRVKVTVRDGGRLRIYSETSGFVLRDGRAAELVVEGEGAGDWELFTAGALDIWDGWVEERERYLAQRLRYDTQYHDQYIWGGEDLDSYGTWAYATEYGWVWRPHASVINSYTNWAPYRNGNWIWCPPYGWTWVGYEPWGWAPYHYGRWVYYNNQWAWCPRSHYHRNRSWWRPALVAFNISFGDNIYWYPLSYHHRDPNARSRRSEHRPRLRDEYRGRWRRHPAYLRAVTGAPTRRFGSRDTRLQPGSGLIARRILDAEPYDGVLPVRPAPVVGDNDSRFTPVRGPRRIHPVPIPDRHTGALNRTPGVRLESDLRRIRLFNGRELRRPVPVDPTGQNETRPTGVVTRPSRRYPTGTTGPERRPVNTPTQPPSETERQPEIRPTRPERTAPRDTAPPRDVIVPPPVPTERPQKFERRERIPPSERDPVTPTPRPKTTERVEPRIDPPVRYDPPSRKADPPSRNDPPARSGPASRPDPPPRNDPPTRSDPSPQKDPPTRSDPPPQKDPPTRSDPPPQKDPPTRSDPPPQKDPPIRSDPPQRNDSPQRSESPRREPPKDEPPPRQQQRQREPM